MDHKGQQALAAAVNPFWSEKVKEVVLGALRPHGLPRGGGGLGSASSTRTGVEDGSMNTPEIRDLLAMILQQNNQLKREIDELKSQRHQQPGVAQPPSENIAQSQRVSGVTEAAELRMLPLEDLKPEDANSEVVGSGNGGDWTTPPGSVPPATTGTRKQPPVVGDAKGLKSEKSGQQQDGTINLLRVRRASTYWRARAWSDAPRRWKHGQWRFWKSIWTVNPVPTDFGWIQSFGENIRTVDLLQLPSIKEGELGGPVLGDWLTLVAPIMKDLSVSSGAWWTAITRGAGEAYQRHVWSSEVRACCSVPCQMC